MASRRKFPDEPGEDFVLKHEESAEVTKNVSVTIHDFTKRIDDLENKRKPIEGPEFRLGEKEFCIDIYPESDPGYIGVFLGSFNNEISEVSCRMKHESGREAFFQNQDIGVDVLDYGAGKFLSHVDYKKWTEDHGDVFKVEVEITLHVKEGNPEPEWEIYPRKRKAAPEFDLLSEVSSMVGNNNGRLFTDFTILSQEGKEFPCHRVILASQSPVMRAMLSRDMKEKEEGKVTVKYSEEVVGHFVEHFYSRKVPQEALQDNLATFFDLAGLYDLAQLKFLTEEAAIGMLSLENMVDLYILGDLYSAANLKTEAEAFIRRNRKELKEMDLTGFPPKVINDVLRLVI